MWKKVFCVDLQLSNYEVHLTSEAMESEPLDVFLKWMRLSGMTDYKAKNSIWILCAVHQIIIVGIHGVTAFINIPLAEEFEDEMESIQLGLTDFHLLTKHINFLVYRKAYSDIYKKIEEAWKECWEENIGRQKMIEAKKSADKWTYGLLIFFFSGIIFQNVVVGFSNMMTDGTKPLLHTYMPESVGSFPFRQFLLSYLVAGPVLADSMCISYYRTTTLLICGLIEFLKLKLQNGGVPDRKFFVLYEKITTMVNDLNKVHSGQIAFEIFMTSLIICFRGYSCMKLLANNDWRALGFIYILGLCLISTYLICDNGALLIDASEELRQDLYSMNWYERSAKSNRDLRIMALFTSEPMTLNYKKMVTFDMVRFGGVLQGTYSYLTFLKFFDT